MEQRTINVWVHIYPAPDLPSVWVAHALELDLVTQGRTPRHAYEMVCEAADMVVLDDLNAEREPTLRRAPPEVWEPLWMILREGARLPEGAGGLEGEGCAGRVLEYAVQIQLSYKRVAVECTRPAPVFARGVDRSARDSAAPAC